MASETKILDDENIKSLIKCIKDKIGDMSTDKTTSSAISSDDTNLITGRSVYYGLPYINGSHSYTNATNIYAPTSAGTNGYDLISNGSGAPVWRAPLYAVCSTAEATAAKTISITNYNHITGNCIKIKFSNNNIASSPTLNVNSTGAYPIKFNGGVAVSTGDESPMCIHKDTIYEMMFDGSSWIILGDNYENSLTSKMYFISDADCGISDVEMEITHSLYVNSNGSKGPCLGKRYVDFYSEVYDTAIDYTGCADFNSVVVHNSEYPTCYVPGVAVTSDKHAPSTASGLLFTLNGDGKGVQFYIENGSSGKTWKRAYEANSTTSFDSWKQINVDSDFISWLGDTPKTEAMNRGYSSWDVLLSVIASSDDSVLNFENYWDCKRDFIKNISLDTDSSDNKQYWVFSDSNLKFYTDRFVHEETELHIGARNINIEFGLVDSFIFDDLHGDYNIRPGDYTNNIGILLGRGADLYYGKDEGTIPCDIFRYYGYSASTKDSSNQYTVSNSFGTQKGTAAVSNDFGTKAASNTFGGEATNNSFGCTDTGVIGTNKFGLHSSLSGTTTNIFGGSASVNFRSTSNNKFGSFSAQNRFGEDSSTNYFAQQNTANTMTNYFGYRGSSVSSTLTNYFGGSYSNSYRSNINNYFGRYAYNNYFGISSNYNYFGTSATYSYYRGETVYIGDSTSKPVYLQSSTYKVVGTTSGYNSKIHVGTSTPTSNFNVGDFFFKIPS